MIDFESAAFAYLDGLVAGESEASSTSMHLDSVRIRGQTIALIQHMRGIASSRGWRPPSAFSRRTPRARIRPYDDGIGPDGYQSYKWRGTDGDAADNVALRATRELNKPLMWFFGIARASTCPCIRSGSSARSQPNQQFVVALDDVMRDQWTEEVFHPADLALRRQYAEATVKRRLHQPAFRMRVLRAYDGSCALCRLRHPELLDAAHIKEDSDGGEPVVPNGVAMCAIHHRAFDANVLGIRPDFIVQIREDVLEEHDGPTLRHALQGVHGEKLVLPRQRGAHPDRDLARRTIRTVPQGWVVRRRIGDLTRPLDSCEFRGCTADLPNTDERRRHDRR